MAWLGLFRAFGDSVSSSAQNADPDVLYTSNKVLGYSILGVAGGGLLTFFCCFGVVALALSKCIGGERRSRGAEAGTDEERAPFLGGSEGRSFVN